MFHSTAYFTPKKDALDSRSTIRINRWVDQLVSRLTMWHYYSYKLVGTDALPTLFQDILFYEDFTRLLSYEKRVNDACKKATAINSPMHPRNINFFSTLTVTL